MPLKRLVTICIFGVAFGAASIGKQDDNADMVQTRLDTENKTKIHKEPTAVHHAGPHHKSNKSHESSKSNEVTKSKESSQSTETSHSKAKETHHSKETGKAVETSKSKESSKSEETTHSKETVKAKETSKSKGTSKSNATTKSNETEDCGGNPCGRGRGRGRARRQRSMEAYYDDQYYYYEPQKWLANMSFTLAGLSHDKIIADGQIHFAVLWNLKSEIADGFGVPFENVSIFLSDGDGGFLHVAAVVVAPKQSLQATPSDINVHIIDRLNAIPDIENGKTEPDATIAITVTLDRADGGVPTSASTPADDPNDRRRRSPATHEPTAAPLKCTGTYLGFGVIPAGADTTAGDEVEFSCSNGGDEKYPLTGKVACGSVAIWEAFSSGAASGAVSNWGCAGAGACWERPRASDGTLPTGLENPQYTSSPFAPVNNGEFWCAGSVTQSPCCPTGSILTSDGTAAGVIAAGVQCNNGAYANAAGTLGCVSAR